MLHPPAPYQLRRMHFTDIDAVLAIDRLSFPTPAKPELMAYEVDQNQVAHYQVLLAEKRAIGYAGYWLLVDEAHISTIAIHPDRRRQGLGELLLLNLLYLAGAQGATIATLEVRRSNRAAQALYHKYLFEVAGERRGYYRDTREDALIMTVILKDHYYSDTLHQAKRALFSRLTSAE